MDPWCTRWCDGVFNQPSIHAGSFGTSLYLVDRTPGTLIRVDGSGLNAAQRVAAKTSLDAYVRQVSAADQDALRWTDALDRIRRVFAIGKLGRQILEGGK